MTDANGRRTASIRFTGITERDRYAEKVFEHYLELPDPNDPTNAEKRMRPQHILIEALNALGQRLEKEGIVLTVEPDEITLLRQSIETRLSEMMEFLVLFDQKISHLQSRGVLSPEQVQEVKQALDESKIDDTFRVNMSKALRQGKAK